MVKKSNDTFQILLKNHLRKDKYKESRKNFLKDDDEIIRLLDNKLNENDFVLSETLLYFFEKNSLNYLKNIIGTPKEIIGKDKKKQKVIIHLDDEPLEILKDCCEFLIKIIDQNYEQKLKEICKLYCLGYIKSYIHTFVKALEDNKCKSEETEKIITFINGENPLFEMMRIYIYKILYNKFKIDVFINQKMISKYKLKSYKNFDNFVKTNDLKNIHKIDYQIKTLQDDDYDETNKIIEKYNEEGFKNKIKKKDSNIIEQFSFDNFYIVSYNLTLYKLLMENSEINNNFFINICKPLYEDKKLLFKAIQLFYDPKTFNKIKKALKIDSNNIKTLLFGYRYCLNELSCENENGIYYPLYKENNINYLTDYYYPGNDTEPNNIYSKIINHFKTKPNQGGCYACLCKEGGFYHFEPSGFPNTYNVKRKCPHCHKFIGIIDKGWINKDLKLSIREDYYRILKDNKEIEEIKKDKVKINKFGEINYMTLEQYKKKYFCDEKEKGKKGIFIPVDKNYFKNNFKVIRNLSQISFRILNYILYIHLFFASLITEKRDVFNKYLPKGMSWVETLSECWNILNTELLKENINSIEKFLSYIFSDLFPKINKEKKIESYDSLIKFEDSLELEIQKIIKNYRKVNDTNECFKKKNEDDKSSLINLLKEKYTKYDYKKDEFPFYEYFYYSDYLNEKYIAEKLIHMDEGNYPVLRKYLESKGFLKTANKDKQDSKKYPLEHLNLFNSTLNLINEKYSNQISREGAQRKLKYEEIYINNKGLIDDFIKFYNSLNENDNIELGNDNPLCDFLLDDSNKFGKTYKKIYKNFIKEQNRKVEILLNDKILKGIFDDNCKNKIKIQQIKEMEIFTLILPKKYSFIDILFNSSYRKILDSETKSYELYKEFEINYDLIEENLTELLLSNKKLLNDDIDEFVYNNEVFSNQVTDIMTTFNKRYNIKIISLDDKKEVYKFCEENKNNVRISKKMINDFIRLFKYLNDKKIENNNIDKDKDITEETKIYEIINKLKDDFSETFKKLFEKKDSFTIDKASGIFSYYLKKIYEDVKNEINKYQIDLDDESEKTLNNYYQKEHSIKKGDFAKAIELFITLVLFLEEDRDKETLIKSNHNNVVNYLKSSDLWDKDIYNNENFGQNLNELKNFNIPICQIISLHDFLVRDIEDNSDEEIKKIIEEEEEGEISKMSKIYYLIK